MIGLEERVKERFEADVAEHQAILMHDDGSYRHLRCQKPGTWMYGFDIVTWPGYLAIVGDNGDYMFSRIPDMFDFFESKTGRINPDYWAQKLQGPGHDTARCYSPDLFEKRVQEWLETTIEGFDGEDPDRAKFLRLAVQNDILFHEYHNEHEAHELLSNFQAEGVTIHDHYEWDLREFDQRFLWCCYAIVWGIEQYREATK